MFILVGFEQRIHDTLNELNKLYSGAVRPLEQMYNFNDLNKHVVTGNINDYSFHDLLKH